MIRRILLAGILLATLASCDTATGANSLRTFTTNPEGTRQVDSGAGWLFDIDDTQQCIWVHADRITATCIGAAYRVGDVATTQFQGGDVQLTLVIIGSRVPLEAWWSTSARGDRFAFVEVQPDVWAAVSPMATGETVWGVQARLTDGTVEHVISLPDNVGIQR